MSNFTYATNVTGILPLFQYINDTIGGWFGLIILVTTVVISFLVFYRVYSTDESAVKKAFIISSTTGLFTSIIFTIVSILDPIYLILMIVLFTLSIVWSFAGGG